MKIDIYKKHWREHLKNMKPHEQTGPEGMHSKVKRKEIPSEVKMCWSSSAEP